LARRYPIDDPSHPAWGQAMAAAILGTAIAGQHYTAMSAARFYPAPPHAIDPWRPTFAVTALPAIVLIAMLAILVIALVSATVDRRARDRVSLSQRLLGAQEAERRRISGVLHEDLGGLLTALRLNLQRYTSAPPPAPVATDNLELVDEALERVRAIALELRPAVLDDLGLGPAVAGYARRQAERAGYNLTIEDTLDSMRLPEEMETVSFRILQQALTNIARHAEASNVHVVLLRTVDRFELSVTDDGVGFDVATARARAVAGESLGLLDMNELATLAGGQLSISSYPGRGSTVNAYFYMGSR
jgi:signal transduction histidine kinase